MRDLQHVKDAEPAVSAHNLSALPIVSERQLAVIDALSWWRH